MPRAKQLETYPNNAFWAVVSRVLGTGKEFLIPCTKAQAASMRGELYAWRRACESAPEKAEQLGITPSQLRNVAYRISDTGMTALPAEQLQTAGLIAQALGGTVPQPTSAASAALENFRKIMEDRDD